MDHTEQHGSSSTSATRRFGVAVSTIAFLAVAGVAPFALKGAFSPKKAVAAAKASSVGGSTETPSSTPTTVKDQSGPGTTPVAVTNPQPSDKVHTPKTSRPARSGSITNGHPVRPVANTAGQPHNPYPPTTPATEAPACHNSYESACGEFSWTTPPGTNQPMTLHVTYTPAHPKVGDEVVFTVKASDPDARISYSWFSPGDGSKGRVPSAQTCKTPHGAWTTPQRYSDEQTFTFTHTYEKAGKFTVWFDVASENSADPGNDCVDPYGSELARTICIQVAEEPQNEPETPPSPYEARKA